jgi:hypothetical protein
VVHVWWQLRSSNLRRRYLCLDLPRLVNGERCVIIHTQRNLTPSTHRSPFHIILPPPQGNDNYNQKFDISYKSESRVIETGGETAASLLPVTATCAGPQTKSAPALTNSEEISIYTHFRVGCLCDPGASVTCQYNLDGGSWIPISGSATYNAADCTWRCGQWSTGNDKYTQKITVVTQRVEWVSELSHKISPPAFFYTPLNTRDASSLASFVELHRR